MAIILTFVNDANGWCLWNINLLKKSFFSCAVWKCACPNAIN